MSQVANSNFIFVFVKCLAIFYCCNEVNSVTRTRRAFVPNFPCPSRPVIGRYPDPDPKECTSFIYCISGTAYPGKCRAGQIFNAMSSRCVQYENNDSLNCGSVSGPATVSPSPISPTPVNPLLTQLLTQPSTMNAGSSLPSSNQIQNISSLFGNPNAGSLLGSVPNALSPALIGLLNSTINQGTINNNGNKPVQRPIVRPKPLPQSSSIHHTFDCVGKPCGLYPNINDCKSYFLCSGGKTTLKHCNDGQQFDTETLECQPESKAKCWKEPEDEPFTPPPVPKLCPFHNLTKTNETTQNVNGHLVLTSPMLHNWGTWSPWQNCPQGTFVSGVNAWRRLIQSSSVDHAGLVSLGFECSKPDGTQRSGIFVITPGVPNDGFSSYYQCGGTAVGFQLNSQPDQGGGDDLATDNVDLICSCGTHARKPYETFTGSQSGNRGQWTQPRMCDKKQAICGMQAQVLPFQSNVGPSYDNTGIDNLRTACCNVSNPAESCDPEETTMFIRNCRNPTGYFRRRCDFNVTIGLGYAASQLQESNFYESIGYSLKNQSDALKQTLIQNLANNYQKNATYDWNLSLPDVWEVKESTNRSVYIVPGTEVEIRQIQGKCGFYTLGTNWLEQKTTNITTGESVTEYFTI